jgi:ParB-like chromosome segregation protein Spo0J
MNEQTKNEVVVRSLERVKFWEWNPRGSNYRGMPELVSSLAREGLQDAIHVWERVDGDYLLKGHRRFEAMSTLGWTECAQVVHHYEDEAAAYRFLLEDHGHNDPLDAEEKIVAVENGVKLGMRTDELAPSLGVSAERAQLWFELGEQLPQSARAALSDGRLSMNTAELLLEVLDAKDRRAATQMILKDLETGEPMAHGQAKAYIQAHYVLPEKRRKEWLAREVALRKKYKVAKGYHFVEWAERREFAMGESGQPQPEFEFGDVMMPKDREGRTWEQVALEIGVPVYVVAAPLHAEGHVRLVNSSMMRDALSVKPPTEVSDDDADDEQETTVEVLPPPVSTMPIKAEAMEEVEQLRQWLRTNLGAIYDELLEYPTLVLTSAPWEPLRDFLAHLTTDVDAGALEAWRGITDREAAMEWMRGDKKQRAPMRCALMLLLCAESDSSDEPMKVISEVAKAIGVGPI